MVKTTIFLIRHAKKSNNVKYLFSKEEIAKDLLRPLSMQGILQSQKITELDCLKNIEAIYSSEFSRAVMTAIPLSETTGCSIQVTNAFNERLRRKTQKFELPSDFRLHQMYDIDYKLPDGESRRDVCSRFNKGIFEVLKKYLGKQIAIFTHKTAITMFLMQYCNYQIKNDVSLNYEGNIIFDGKWNGSPEIFKIIFDNQQLIYIEKIDNLCSNT